MTEIIKKLIDKKIFKIGTLVDAPVIKYHMGTPMTLTKTLRIKQVNEDHCVADEEYEIEADVPLRKIYFHDIIMIDGMEPQELAAVYGLSPRTERFKVKKDDK
jgi:hypothetical protein